MLMRHFLRHRIVPLLAVASALLAAQELRADFVLDPQPDFQEFHGAVAIRPDGGVLLTWTREPELGEPFSVMAATLDPDSAQLGELHEIGPGDSQQVVPLGTGYLAVREDFNPNFDWTVERLDESGRPARTVLPIGFAWQVVARALPDGGAAVIAAGVGGTGGPAQAWRIGPDGTPLAGPVTLTENSLEASAGVDGDGNLVVAWTDSGTRVFARRFSPDLEPLGPVLSVALGGARGVRVAVAPDGRFVVLYAHEYQLFARPFKAGGGAAGGKVLLSLRDDFVAMDDFSVALGPGGTILTVWKTYQGNVPVIRGRFLTLAGRPVGKLLTLARIPFGHGELLRPRVESLGDDFLAVWAHVGVDRRTSALEGRRLSAP
jgi:hypothetical protein